MSKTPKPIAPSHKNSKQVGNQKPMAHHHERHGAATSAPGTITAGVDTADGVVKSSAKPRVGEGAHHRVQIQPRSYTEIKGR